MISKEKFKSDILSVIFNVSSKIYGKVLLVSLINATISFIFILIGKTFLLNNFTSINTLGLKNTDDVIELYKDIFMNFFTNPMNVFYISVFIFVTIVLSIWMYNFILVAGDKSIKGIKISFGDLLRKTINKDILRALWAMFLIYIIMAIVFFIVAFIFSISILAGILAFILCLVFFNMFYLVMPALIIDKHSFSSSLAISFHHMSFLRALKLFGIEIIAGIVIMIALIIIALISMIFTFIPLVGEYIQLAINAGINAFISSLFVISSLALYYRYVDIKEIDSKNPEDSEFDMDNYLISN